MFPLFYSINQSHYKAITSFIHSFILQYSYTPQYRMSRDQQLYLLLADLHWKLKEMTWRNQGLTFANGGFPLLLGPV